MYRLHHMDDAELQLTQYMLDRGTIGTPLLIYMTRNMLNNSLHKQTKKENA